MDVFLLIVAIVLVLAGIIGSVLPVIQGPPLSFIGLLLLHFSNYASYSTPFLVIMGFIATGITALDYFIPALGTKQFGGTKTGRNGALIGVIAGIFIFPPIGIILGPFVGAFLGELIHDGNDYKKAFKSGIGSFLGFLLGTGLKLMFGFFIIYKFISALFYA